MIKGAVASISREIASFTKFPAKSVASTNTVTEPSIIGLGKVVSKVPFKLITTVTT